MKKLNLELNTKNIELRFPEEVSNQDIRKALEVLKKAENVNNCYMFDPKEAEKKEALRQEEEITKYFKDNLFGYLSMDVEELYYDLRENCVFVEFYSDEKLNTIKREIESIETKWSKHLENNEVYESIDDSEEEIKVNLRLKFKDINVYNLISNVNKKEVSMQELIYSLIGEKRFGRKFNVSPLSEITPEKLTLDCNVLEEYVESDYSEMKKIIEDRVISIYPYLVFEDSKDKDNIRLIYQKKNS